MNTFRETAAAAASLALSKVGCPYSQAKRAQSGIYDCSSLVARVYTAQGKKWKYGGSVPISCDEVYDDDFELLWPNSYADIGRKMGGKDVIAMADQPGDVQYICTDFSTSRSNKITHVAMVADKNRIVHARGTRYGVVTSPINLYAGKVCAVVRYNPACSLRIGMKGFRTEALQRKLRFLGYDVVIDGDYGERTAKAVKEYQGRLGLEANGNAGVSTLEALFPVMANATLQESTLVCTVTGDTVNVRMGPGTNYPILRTAHSGDSFESISTDKWIPIHVGDQILWISAAYAHLTKAA